MGLKDLLKKPDELIDNANEKISGSMINIANNIQERKQLEEKDEFLQIQNQVESNLSIFSIFVFLTPIFGTIAPMLTNIFIIGIDGKVLRNILAVTFSSLVVNILGGVISYRAFKSAIKSATTTTYRSVCTPTVEELKAQNADLQNRLELKTQELEVWKKEHEGYILARAVDEKIKAMKEDEAKKEDN